MLSSYRCKTPCVPKSAVALPFLSSSIVTRLKYLVLRACYSVIVCRLAPTSPKDTNYTSIDVSAHVRMHEHTPKLIAGIKQVVNTHFVSFKGVTCSSTDANLHRHGITASFAQCVSAAYLTEVPVNPLAPLRGVLSEGCAILGDVHGHPQLAAVADGPVQGGWVHGVPHLCHPPGPPAAGLQVQTHNASAYTSDCSEQCLLANASEDYSAYLQECKDCKSHLWTDHEP